MSSLARLRMCMCESNQDLCVCVCDRQDLCVGGAVALSASTIKTTPCHAV